MILGGINNVKAEHIVKIQSDKDTELPPLVVKSLHVDNNLQVGMINDLKITNFLSDCIYINSTENQKFTQLLHINGNLFLEGINTYDCSIVERKLSTQNHFLKYN